MQHNMPNPGGATSRQARLIVLSNNQSIPLVFTSADDQLVVGRRDPELRVFPDADLRDAAQWKTVGRRHAYLRLRQGTFTIEDLNALNKTQLNGVTLNPRQEYDLADNDLLRFGSVEVRFEIR